MERPYPVYTLENECQDCYKCIRGCPVKAIKIENGHATVMPELCVACGRCVETCPANAKQVRDDLPVLRELLASGAKVYASLAPSWISQFKNVTAEQMCAALRRIGFAGVSETALGAQLVSTHVARMLEKMDRGVVISSACPTVVDLVCKYIPEFAETISQVVSPAMAHARSLRETFGEEIKVVFIGPCIGKKNEADRHSEVLNLALGYQELKRLLEEEGIDLSAVKPEKDDRFVPESAAEGAIYPIEGGMIDTIRIQCANEKVKYACVTGLENLQTALNGLVPEAIKDTIFLEVLSCPGGCVHGPCTDHNSPGLLERLRVLDYVKHEPTEPTVRPEPAGLAASFLADAPPEARFSEEEIRNALRRVGKTSPENELNCGSCGYDKCRIFAAAMLEEKAEPSMCMSYMRDLAQKKANALLRCIPSGVVLVDGNLKLIECNTAFARIFGDDVVAAYEALPGMSGADLTRIVPFANLFKNVLESGKDISQHNCRVGKKLLSVTIFTIEPHETAGAVIFDVTNTETRREEIARRARSVISRNLETVQEIACKLGENMADTEILLRSIAEDYADTTPVPGNRPNDTAAEK